MKYKLGGLKVYKLPKEYHMEKTFWDYYNVTNKTGLYPIQIIEHSEIPNYIENFNNYDIETEDNHNYFAGGILVHNSNASFCIDNTNELGVSCYSRNTPLSAENTLRGYYRFAIDKIVPIKDKLNPNYRCYGEWLVSHKVQYKPEAYNKFYLFSIWDEENNKYLSDDIVKSEAEKLGLETVTYFYEGEYISFEHLMSFVGKSNMTLEPNTGEGVVVKNVNYFDNFGRQVFVKLVSEKFAEVQKQKLPKNPNVNVQEIQLVKSVLTNARIDKLIHKLVDEGLLDENYGIEDMGIILRQLGTKVYDDIMKEEFDLFKDYEVDSIKRIIGKNTPNVVKEVLKEQGRS